MPSYPGKWRGTHQAKAHVTMRQRRRRRISRRRGFSFPHPASAARGGWEPDARDAPCAARDVFDPGHGPFYGNALRALRLFDWLSAVRATIREFPEVSTSISTFAALGPENISRECAARRGAVQSHGEPSARAGASAREGQVVRLARLLTRVPSHHPARTRRRIVPDTRAARGHRADDLARRSRHPRGDGRDSPRFTR